MQLPPTKTQVEANKRLESALNDCNAEFVEFAVTKASLVLHPIHASILIRLVEAPWHKSHEDVVHLLQVLRSPDAVSVLEKSTFAAHGYLAYDNNYALARKCTWALADIGTPEAYQTLTRIATCADTTIAGYARRRLDNWQIELSRKGK